MSIARYILVLGALCVALSACASTKMTCFSDPSFQGAQFSNFVVQVANGDLEAQSLISSKACEALSAEGAHCTPALEVFPPTRTFSNQEKADLLRSKDVDGYLVIILGGGSSSSQYIGSQHFGTVNVYGNTATGSGGSVPIYAFTRMEGYDLVLVDTETLQKAWVGGARTSGRGLLNITDNVFASSLGHELADSLKEAGHL